jgi:mannose-6-phosphate isomerase-like protein (cupin superfamily)
MPRKLNLAEAFGRIDEHYSPRIAGEVNDFQVKIVKLKGEFVWHHHEQEDELFLVVKGRLLMHFRDGDEWIQEGEMIVVPHGVEHCPDVPEGEAHVFDRARRHAQHRQRRRRSHREPVPLEQIRGGRPTRHEAGTATPHTGHDELSGHRPDTRDAAIRGDLGQAQRSRKI